ncbi:MAG TPA: Ku protein, partial [Candidatus Dormibacteraeota bacterium]
SIAAPETRQAPAWADEMPVPRASARELVPSPRLEEPEPVARPAVSASEVVRGFEVGRDRYVTLEPEDLAELAPEQTRTIDIEQFVEVGAVDPIYFDRSYYAVPDRDHARPYALLTEAMRETKKLAICWFVLRRKRYLAAVRADGNLMILTTLFFADEIVPRAGLEPRPVADLTKREREMARLLLNTLTGPFEPERYPDDYRQRVQALIEGRIKDARPVPAHQAGRSPGIDELMAALQASVSEAQLQRKAKPRPLARRKRKTA